MDAVTFLSVLLTGAALSMDAFAVAVCKGMAIGNACSKKACTVGVWFGIFQALMPLGGYYLMHFVITFLSGTAVNVWFERVDHFIACFILAYIGINMIREAIKGEDDGTNASLGFKTMLIMSIATSIDAFATGMAMRMDGELNIFLSVAVIGLTTFVLSFIGVKAGGFVGEKFSTKAQIAGGVVLILLGIKIVIEHMFLS